MEGLDVCELCASEVLRLAGGRPERVARVIFKLAFESRAPLLPHHRRKTRSHCKGDAARPKWNRYSVDRYIPAQQKPR